MSTVYEMFMAKRIIAGAKLYPEVVAARGDLKTGIDLYLTAQNRADLIIE